MSVAFGASKDRWGSTTRPAGAAGLSFRDIYDAYMGEGPKILSEKLLLNEALLSMVIRHHPSPQVAQSYRIPKIWHGDLTSPVGKALLTCDENGPTVMMVTAIVVDPAAGLVATGRLFSGHIRDGDAVYLSGAKRQGRVQSVQRFTGIQRET